MKIIRTRWPYKHELGPGKALRFGGPWGAIQRESIVQETHFNGTEFEQKNARLHKLRVVLQVHRLRVLRWLQRLHKLRGLRVLRGLPVERT